MGPEELLLLSSQQQWMSVGRAIWLSAWMDRLMDGAHPLWPAEFYLRLTSRCCHRRSTRAISLINLSPPPLFPLSLSPCPHMPPMANLSLSAASSEPAGIPPHSGSAASLHQTDKQGGEQTPALIHIWGRHTHIHTGLFTESKIWMVSWVLAAICWCKNIAKLRAKEGWCVSTAVALHIFGLWWGLGLASLVCSKMSVASATNIRGFQLLFWQAPPEGQHLSLSN